MVASAQRAQQRRQTLEDEAEIRAILLSHNIPLPVRWEPAEVLDPEAPTSGTFRDEGNGVYLHLASGEKSWHKVQKKKGAWTCSCPKWKKQRKVDCQHIKRVQQETESGGPYSTARRRPPAKYIYPEGEPKEGTRRFNAYRAMPTRVPELFEELCQMIDEPVEEPRRGAPSVPLRVRAYALLIKSYFRLTYAELAARLTTDPAVQRLGWMRALPISINTLCSSIAIDPRLEDVFDRMIPDTASVGRLIEEMGALDSSGLPLIMVANYNESKHGKVRKRKGRRFLKVHWLVGVITGLIAAVDLSLESGYGSGDAPHLRGLTRRAKQVFTLMKRLLADKAYGADGNSKACVLLKVLLITRERSGEDRSTWSESAAQVAKLERERPAVFNEYYRMRGKSETTPSRVKRRNPHQRLRRRTFETQDAVAIQTSDEAMCDWPDEKLSAVMDAALKSVGIAQRNEAKAMAVAANVRAGVMLEHYHDDRICYPASTAFRPIRTVKESELVGGADYSIA